ncbi:hypothetical protein KIPB_008596, partial [Kipferlia bialata]
RISGLERLLQVQETATRLSMAETDAAKEQMKAQADRLRTENDTLTAEKAKEEAERDRYRAERDEARAEAQEARAERDERVARLEWRLRAAEAAREVAVAERYEAEARLEREGQYFEEELVRQFEAYRDLTEDRAILQDQVNALLQAAETDHALALTDPFDRPLTQPEAEAQIVAEAEAEAETQPETETEIEAEATRLGVTTTSLDVGMERLTETETETGCVPSHSTSLNPDTEAITGDTTLGERGGEREPEAEGTYPEPPSEAPSVTLSLPVSLADTGPSTATATVTAAAEGEREGEGERGTCQEGEPAEEREREREGEGDTAEPFLAHMHQAPPPSVTPSVSARPRGYRPSPLYRTVEYGSSGSVTHSTLLDTSLTDMEGQSGLSLSRSLGGEEERERERGGHSSQLENTFSLSLTPSETHTPEGTTVDPLNPESLRPVSPLASSGIGVGDPEAQEEGEEFSLGEGEEGDEDEGESEGVEDAVCVDEPFPASLSLGPQEGEREREREREAGCGMAGGTGVDGTDMEGQGVLGTGGWQALYHHRTPSALDDTEESESSLFSLPGTPAMEAAAQQREADLRRRALPPRPEPVGEDESEHEAMCGHETEPEAEAVAGYEHEGEAEAEAGTGAGLSWGDIQYQVPHLSLEEEPRPHEKSMFLGLLADGDHGADTERERESDEAQVEGAVPAEDLYGHRLPEQQERGHGIYASDETARETEADTDAMGVGLPDASPHVSDVSDVGQTLPLAEVLEVEEEGEEEREDVGVDVEEEAEMEVEMEGEMERDLGGEMEPEQEVRVVTSGILRR